MWAPAPRGLWQLIAEPQGRPDRGKRAPGAQWASPAGILSAEASPDLPQPAVLPGDGVLSSRSLRGLICRSG